MTQNTSKIQVIDRAVTLINIISTYDKAVSLKFLAADSGLHASTAFRILASLITHGVVERTQSGEYRLGTRLLHWGNQVRGAMGIHSEARPVMQRLRDEIGETVNLTVREGDEVVYVERVTGRHAIRVEQVIGSRAPLHVTAVGKLMLADMEESTVLEFAQRTGLPRFTDNTLSTAQDLMAQIHKDREQGFALDNEEAELGVGCIGVLIRDSSGEVVAGLSVSAPIERRKAQWVQAVMAAGKAISERLGYRG